MALPITQFEDRMSGDAYISPFDPASSSGDQANVTGVSGGLPASEANVQAPAPNYSRIAQTYGAQSPLSFHNPLHYGSDQGGLQVAAPFDVKDVQARAYQSSVPAPEQFGMASQGRAFAAQEEPLGNPPAPTTGTPDWFKQYIYQGGVDDAEATRRGIEWVTQQGMRPQDAVKLWNSALGTQFNVNDFFRTSGQAAPSTTTVFGDSISSVLGYRMDGSADTSRGNSLEGILSDYTGGVVNNVATGGQTSHDALTGNTAYGTFDNYIATNRPNQVILRYGAADAIKLGDATASLNNIEQMIQTAQRYGSVPVLVGVSPFFGGADSIGGNIAGYLTRESATVADQINAGIQQLAQKYNLPFVDVRSVGIPAGALLDGVHQNAELGRLMADKIGQTLSQTRLAKKEPDPNVVENQPRYVSGAGGAAGESGGIATVALARGGSVFSRNVFTDTDDSTDQAAEFDQSLADAQTTGALTRAGLTSTGSDQVADKSVDQTSQPRTDFSNAPADAKSQLAIAAPAPSPAPAPAPAAGGLPTAAPAAASAVQQAASASPQELFTTLFGADPNLADQLRASYNQAFGQGEGSTFYDAGIQVGDYTLRSLPISYDFAGERQGGGFQATKNATNDRNLPLETIYTYDDSGAITGARVRYFTGSDSGVAIDFDAQGNKLGEQGFDYSESWKGAVAPLVSMAAMAFAGPVAKSLSLTLGGGTATLASNIAANAIVRGGLGAAQAGLMGGDVLKGALTGAATGALGAGAASVANAAAAETLNLTGSQVAADAVRGAVQSGLNAVPGVIASGGDLSDLARAGLVGGITSGAGSAIGSALEGTGITSGQVSAGIRLAQELSSGKPNLSAIADAAAGLVNSPNATVAAKAVGLLNTIQKAGSNPAAWMGVMEAANQLSSAVDRASLPSVMSDKEANAFLAAKSAGASDEEALATARAAVGGDAIDRATARATGLPITQMAIPEIEIFDEEWGNLSQAQKDAANRMTLTIGADQADSPQEAAALAKAQGYGMFTFGGNRYALRANPQEVLAAAGQTIQDASGRPFDQAAAQEAAKGFSKNLAIGTNFGIQAAQILKEKFGNDLSWIDQGDLNAAASFVLAGKEDQLRSLIDSGRFGKTGQNLGAGEYGFYAPRDITNVDRDYIPPEGFRIAGPAERDTAQVAYDANGIPIYITASTVGEGKRFTAAEQLAFEIEKNRDIAASQIDPFTGQAEEYTVTEDSPSLALVRGIVATAKKGFGQQIGFAGDIINSDRLREVGAEMNMSGQRMTADITRQGQSMVGDVLRDNEGFNKLLGLWELAKNNPAAIGAAFGDWIGTEGAQEFLPVGGSVAAGRALTNAAKLAFSEKIARKIGVTGAVTVNAGLDGAEAYQATYNDVKEKLLGMGFSNEQAETNARLAGAGSAFAEIASSIIGEGPIVAAATKAIPTKFLKSAAAEAPSEAIASGSQEALTQLATQRAGTGLDIGAIQNQAIIGGLVGPGTTGAVAAAANLVSTATGGGTNASGSTTSVSGDTATVTNQTGQTTNITATAGDISSGNLATNVNDAVSLGTDAASVVNSVTQAATNAGADPNAATTEAVNAANAAGADVSVSGGVVTSTQTQGGVTTNSTVDNNAGTTQSTSTNNNTGTTTQSSSDANTGVSQTTSTNQNTGATTQTMTDSKSGTTTQTESNAGVNTQTATNNNTSTNTQTDTSTNVTTQTSTNNNTGVTTETTTDANNNTTTSSTTDTNTGVNTQTTTDNNTGVTTSTATDTNTGVTTETQTNTNTGVTTQTQTDTNTGTTTQTQTDTNTGVTTQTTTDTNTGVTTQTTTDTSTGVNTQTTTDANTGVTTQTATDTSTGITTQTTTDTNTGVTTETQTDSNITTQTQTDTNTGVTTQTQTDTNTGVTTQTTTDTNTGTTTNTTTDTNTGVTTQITTNENTGVTTEITTDVSTGITTQTTTDGNITTNTTTDTNSGQTITVVTDTTTGRQMVIGDDLPLKPLTPIKSLDPVKPVTSLDPIKGVDPVKSVEPVAPVTPPNVKTPTVKPPSTRAPAAAMALPAFYGGAQESGSLAPQMLESRVTQGYVDPLAQVRQAQEQFERDAMMQNIDPRLMQILSERMGSPQGGLDQAANEQPYYSYGQEDSIDDILGGSFPEAVNYANGGYVQPLQAKEGGMALPLLAKAGGLPTHKGREDFKDGKHVAGEGDGQSDDIPAWLADGEFVFPADVVSALGNGSTKAGTDKLYEMMHNIRERARSKGPKDLPPPALKSPLDYLKSKR